jgi:NitT/TauT family transport system ATP-binding protein
MSTTSEERGASRPTSDAVAVTVRDVNKSFRAPDGSTLSVLEHVEFTVGKGEFLCIVGPSGCGKTTMLRILAGLDVETTGEVVVEGAKAGSGATGFVFQRAALFPWRTVRRNVSFSLDLAAARASQPALQDKAARKRRVDAALRLTDLTEFADYYPHQISGGMQQRVNLARALVIEPPVLLMDEPFSALDAQTRERLQREFAEMLDVSGTSTVFITHDIREAVFLGDRVLVFSPRPGRIIGTYEVNAARPRTAEFQQSDELAELAREIWLQLHANESAENES